MTTDSVMSFLEASLDHLDDGHKAELQLCASPVLQNRDKEHYQGVSPAWGPEAILNALSE